MQILKRAKERTMAEKKELTDNVNEIIKNVRQKGDEALLAYNKKFDQSERQCLRVSKEEIAHAYTMVSPEDIEGIKKAAANIEVFARAQKAALKEIPAFSPREGITLGHRVIPVDSCLCYVPGGGYPLYSTALMLAIPAKAAGVKLVKACSPPLKGSGEIHPKTLVAMDIAGVDEIYALGGAHAIAAFAYGTAQIAPVAMIVGPGNQYVAEAKRQCYGKVGIDFVAGPSEVLIIADESASPQIIAADILAQSEHDLLARGVLVTTSKELGLAVIEEVEEQLKTLETAKIAAKSWGDYGEIILAESLEKAAELSNEIAPEHLEIMLKDSESIIPRLCNYGSLFIGEDTAEVFGDYASGTNHTLPTLGAPRYTGGVWAGTFLKVCTHQKMTKEAMKNIAPLVSRMARGEGLIAHAKAAEIRAGILFE